MRSLALLTALCLALTLGSAVGQNLVIHANMGKTFESLQEIDGSYQQVYHLRLNGKGLLYPPKEIQEMDNLQTLSLSDNRLLTLGNALQKCSQLKVLEVDNNDLQEFPMAALTNCTQLEELSARGNALSQLPRALSTLKYLKVLDVGDNKLSSLDTALYLPYLHKLRVDENLLNSVPTFVYRCRNLEYLNVYRNQIKHLDALAPLTRLRTLNIGDNPIESLEPLSQLTQMEHLTLDWIDLDSMPQQHLESLKKLRILSLENCNLTHLPTWVTARRNLEELSLIGNHLTEVPSALFQMRRLRKLWLGKNPLPADQVEALRMRLDHCEINF
ncbi:MAG TPA: leucine-rich repeat domain-containing protein [Saprospiraceae bacterium]|nr:leucine-rich repeat domain-containing protein [Saprospiraceae bacterium]HND87804.1 leucine-rich repeat domain-containing protein [Saprospiraceae bacterium]HNG89006.1 leucine-rich repeat domain-containing protein [Saprospiraceae bacterium]